MIDLFTEGDFLPVDVSQDVSVLVSLITRLQSYANQSAFKLAVHAELNTDWSIHDNDGPVAEALAGDIMLDLLPLVSRALNSTAHPLLRVNFMSGQYDSTLIGTRVESMIDRMAAGLPVAWGNTTRDELVDSGGRSIGYWRGSDRLSFCMVRGEGHLLGLTKSEAMRFILKNKILRAT